MARKFNIEVEVTAGKSEAALGSVDRGARKAGGGLQILEKTAVAAKVALLGLGAGIALGLLSPLHAVPDLLVEVGKEIYEVGNRGQQLRSQLTTAAGGAAQMAEAFQLLQRFSAQTPFELENLIQAYGRLRAIGIQPTEELLTSFGNTAAAWGQDITTYAEAVQGAVTGEMDRLKAFGIVARQEGERVTFLFRGMRTTVAKDAASIVDYLDRIGKTEFAGAMARQAATAEGALSNLRDAQTNLYDSIAQRSGVLVAAEQLFRSLADTLEENRDSAARLSEVLADQLLAVLEGLALRGAGVIDFFDRMDISISQLIALIPGINAVADTLHLLQSDGSNANGGAATLATVRWFAQLRESIAAAREELDRQRPAVEQLVSATASRAANEDRVATWLREQRSSVVAQLADAGRLSANADTRAQGERMAHRALEDATTALQQQLIPTDLLARAGANRTALEGEANRLAREHAAELQRQFTSASLSAGVAGRQVDLEREQAKAIVAAHEAIRGQLASRLQILQTSRDQKEVEKEIQQLQKRAQALLDQYRTPLEKQRDLVAEIGDLYRRQFLTLQQYALLLGRIKAPELPAIQLSPGPAVGPAAPGQLTPLPVSPEMVARAKALADAKEDEARWAQHLEEFQQVYNDLLSEGRRYVEQGLLSQEEWVAAQVKGEDAVTRTVLRTRELTQEMQRAAQAAQGLQQVGGILSQLGGATGNSSLGQWGTVLNSFGGAAGASASATGWLGTLGAVGAWLGAFVTIANTFTTHDGLQADVSVDWNGISAGVTGAMDILGGMLDGMARAGHQMAGQINAVVSAFGGSLEELDAFAVTKWGDRFKVTFETGLSQWFDSIESAMEWATVQALQHAQITGLPPEVEAALRNSRASSVQELTSDLQFAWDYAMRGSGEAAEQLRLFVAHEIEAGRRAEQLGLSLDGLFDPRSMDQWRRQITGQQESDLDRRQREADAYNAEVARLAEWVPQRIAALEAEAAAIAASIAVTQESAAARRELSDYELAELAATRARMAAINGELDILRQLAGNLPTPIAPGEIRASGGGGTRRADRDRLDQMLADAARSRLPDLERSLAEINVKWDEAAALAHGNAEQLAQVNAARRAEIRELYREQLLKYRPTDQSPAAREQEIRDHFARMAEEFGDRPRRLAEILAEETRAIAGLIDEVVGGFNLPLEGVRDRMSSLAESIEWLGHQAEAGEIPLDRFQQILGEVSDQVQGDMYSLAASILEEMGAADQAAEVRRQLRELEFRAQVAQLNLTYQMAVAAGLIAGEAKERWEDLLLYINDPEHWPDFSTGDGGGGGGGGGLTLGDAYGGLSQVNNDLEEARRILQSWQDLGLDDYHRALRDLTQQYDLLRRTLGNTLEVQQAWALALEDLNNRYLGGIRELRDELRLGDLAPITGQQRVEGLAAEFQRLLAVVQGGDLSQANSLRDVARQLLQAYSSTQGTLGGDYLQLYQYVLDALSAVLGEGVMPAGTPLGGPPGGGSNSDTGRPTARPPAGAPADARAATAVERMQQATEAGLMQLHRDLVDLRRPLPGAVTSRTWGWSAEWTGDRRLRLAAH